MMVRQFELRIHPKVFEDVLEAEEYFNSKQNRLGMRFKNSASKQILELTTRAFHHAVKYKNIRCAKVSSFPYLIHYEVDEKAKVVFVHAILCAYRDPTMYWRKRT